MSIVYSLRIILFQSVQTDTAERMTEHGAAVNGNVMIFLIDSADTGFVNQFCRCMTGDDILIREILLFIFRLANDQFLPHQGIEMLHAFLFRHGVG